MRYSIVLMVILAVSCGRLSDEERKKLRDGMEQNKIVKITDDEIVAGALEEGRAIFTLLEKAKFKTTMVDSIEHLKHVRIHWTVPGDKNADAIEQQLIEAYITSIVTGNMQDNIQKLYRKEEPSAYDSLVYSKPIVTPMPDGVENLEGVWNIFLSKKDLVVRVSGKK